MIRKILSLILGSLSIMVCLAAAKENPAKPNIIMLLVDDLGWKDVGFMGSQYYETPNIDRLAEKSMIFTNAYAACAVCSPTRASIMTGRYPARIGVTDWIRARFQVLGDSLAEPPTYQDNEGKKLRTPSNPYWMGLDEVTIAEQLRKAGYFTCHIGKWHLGPDDYYPDKQGFDINIAGCDMGQPVSYFDPYTNEKGISFPTLSPGKEGEYLVDRLAEELVEVVQQKREQPFFINMCYYAVHTPLMAKAEMINKYEAKDKFDNQNNAVYAAMVESVDQAVGKLIETLEKNNLMDNTLIVFFSDNGGLLGSTSNQPLRSGKGYPYEGGIREPMFVYWKDKIEGGAKCNVPVSSIDFFPTFCSITETKLPEGIIDGKDISPLFFKKNIVPRELYWHFPHYRGNDVVPYSIIRDGKWKLIKYYEGKEFELFNLDDDLGEKVDLSDKFPEKVMDLDNKLKGWLVESNAKIPITK